MIFQPFLRERQPGDTFHFKISRVNQKRSGDRSSNQGRPHQDLKTFVPRSIPSASSQNLEIVKTFENCFRDQSRYRDPQHCPTKLPSRLRDPEFVGAELARCRVGCREKKGKILVPTSQGAEFARCRSDRHSSQHGLSKVRWPAPHAGKKNERMT